MALISSYALMNILEKAKLNWTDKAWPTLGLRTQSPNQSFASKETKITRIVHIFPDRIKLDPVDDQQKSPISSLKEINKARFLKHLKVCGPDNTLLSDETIKQTHRSQHARHFVRMKKCNEPTKYNRRNKVRPSKIVARRLLILK